MSVCLTAKTICVFDVETILRNEQFGCRSKESWDFGLWRSIYLLKMTSPKNAVLVALDWVKVKLVGRDISIL